MARRSAKSAITTLFLFAFGAEWNDPFKLLDTNTRGVRDVQFRLTVFQEQSVEVRFTAWA